MLPKEDEDAKIMCVHRYLIGNFSKGLSFVWITFACNTAHQYIFHTLLWNRLSISGDWRGWMDQISNNKTVQRVARRRQSTRPCHNWRWTAGIFPRPPSHIGIDYLIPGLRWQLLYWRSKHCPYTFTVNSSTRFGHVASHPRHGHRHASKSVPRVSSFPWHL